MASTIKQDMENPKANHQQKIHSHNAPERRLITVYDAVAGRIGLNGFLNTEQLESLTTAPSKPDEVLLRRLNAPDEIPIDYYNADERLGPSQRLPSSDLLKDLHAYVADFYEARSEPGRYFDFRSFDETALMAIAILLEEACKECLGEDGDMVFSEPKILDMVKSRDPRSQYQIIGKVIPQQVTEYHSSSEESETIQDKPRKRRRRRYQNTEGE